jgi:signal transduction histidine kinase
MVVHDMRNQLTVLNGFLEMMELAGKGILTTGLAGDLQEALATTSHLNSMVSSLLDVSKLESGAMKLEVVKIDLFEIATTVLEKMAPLKCDKEFMLESPRHPTKVMGDGALISRIFQNLLGNALKYAGPKGKIGVRFAATEAHVQVFITDTGPGVPKDYQEKVFEKFFQVENSVNKVIPSSGLGLNFCKLAVCAHGGHIGVNSTTGQGSEFWFTLPIQGPEAETP